MSDLKTGDVNEKFYELQGKHARQCLREAWVVAGVWLIGGGWIVTSLLMNGYVAEGDRPEVPELTLGMPSWVFWGLVVPWVLLIFVTWGFARFVLKDDEAYMDWPEGERMGE